MREGLRNKATNATWCYRSLALLPHAPPSGAQQRELRPEHGLEGIDLRLGLGVRGRWPSHSYAVEVRNQRPAGVVEAVMSDRCLAATGEMCVAGGANGPYFNSAAQAS